MSVVGPPRPYCIHKFNRTEVSPQRGYVVGCGLRRFAMDDDAPSAPAAAFPFPAVVPAGHFVKTERRGCTYRVAFTQQPALFPRPTGSFGAPWPADRVLVVAVESSAGLSDESRAPRRALEDDFLSWAATNGWRLSGARATTLGDSSRWLNELFFHRS